VPLLALLGSCTGAAPPRPDTVPSASAARDAGTAHAASAARPADIAPLRREDALWLERVAFGLDDTLVRDYERLGRERFLAAQLEPHDHTLPAPIAARIERLEAARQDTAQLIASVRAEHKSINAITDDAAREEARKKLNQEGNQIAYDAIRLELLRAVYSPAQLEEQMVWFWLNHFSVHQNKGQVRWLLADYEEHAIRPHALGHFRDLVLATLEHPAMLEYLDNAQNAVGHVNENYARELMELHTLGVNAGYTQQDVQQLARVLTGVGIAGPNPPRLRPEWQGLYRREGGFEFNPARHDQEPKVLLGRTIRGRGFGEVEDAVDLIVKQPACARFISAELAAYFVADRPPPALVARMAQTFQRTNGDIRAVLRTMFLAHELDGALGGKFKDPMRFVVSAVRFAYDGRPINNARPLLTWLNGLGEAPFARPTPDGYPLVESAWASSGQMSRRFEIARLIGSGNAGLFNPEDGEAAPPASGFPQLSNRLYFAAVEPFLARTTRGALDAAASPQEWNTFLLASPEFNYE
jgi:uncharacterized protein (DUF1800 family)